jgi:hypothetical protein
MIFEDFDVPIFHLPPRPSDQLDSFRRDSSPRVKVPKFGIGNFFAALTQLHK